MKKAKGLVLMLLCGSIPTAIAQQPVVVLGPKPEVTILKSDASPMANEIKCNKNGGVGFFLRSEAKGETRIGFSYVSDRAHSENPLINDVSILIDKDKTAPTFQEMGETGPDGRTQYLLRMNSKTAGQEAICIAGIPIREK